MPILIKGAGGGGGAETVSVYVSNGNEQTIAVSYLGADYAVKSVSLGAGLWAEEDATLTVPKGSPLWTTAAWGSFSGGLQKLNNNVLLCLGGGNCGF